MARAWPRFLRSGWAALRVMHKPEPAVKAGVLAGLSVGGTVDRRDPMDPTIITDLTLRELSLCDVPMLDAARIDLIRSDLAKRYAQPGPHDAIAKVAGLQRERDAAIAKAARFGKLVQRLDGERVALAERLRAAEAERDDRFRKAQVKGALRALPPGVAVVEKAQDSYTTEAPAREAEDPRSLIKAVHAAARR